MEPAPIRYTNIRGGWVAYLTVGDGSKDIVYVPGFLSSIDAFWESPALVRFFSHLSSCGRLIMLDRRGSGLSDRLPADASIVEEWAYDPIGVMDVVGSKSATLVAFDTGTPMALYAAATFPDRVESLILMEPYAVAPAKALADEVFDALLDTIVDTWGDGTTMRMVNPTMPARFNEGFPGSMLGKLERSSLTKGEVGPGFRAIKEVDVSHVLDNVTQPVLMCSSLEDTFIRWKDVRRLAERLNADLVAIDGPNYHGWLMEPDIVLPAIDRFLGGSGAHAPADRMLATVLFSDIVASTERAAAHGDHRWRSSLEAHDRIVSSCVEQEDGRIVKHTGDGVLATFDGPAKAIRATLQIREALGAAGIEVYQGLHTGEVDRRGDDISGLAVHIAARVGALAQPGEVLVTRTVKDLVVGSNLRFEERGAHELKGVPDRWQLYRVIQGSADRLAHQSGS